MSAPRRHPVGEPYVRGEVTVQQEVNGNGSRVHWRFSWRGNVLLLDEASLNDAIDALDDALSDWMDES